MLSVLSSRSYPALEGEPLSGQADTTVFAPRDYDFNTLAVVRSLKDKHLYTDTAFRLPPSLYHHSLAAQTLARRHEVVRVWVIVLNQNE